MPQGLDRATYFARLGEDVEPGGRRPAPEPLRLVQRFLNTSNHELGPSWDRLGSPDRAAAWLARHGLVEPGRALSDDERMRVVDFRSALRDLVETGALSESADAAARRLEEATKSAYLRVRFRDGRPELEPVATGGDRAIALLAAVVYRETLSGRWPRLKPCGECRWIFYDQSKNGTGEWCSMAVCGNRAKNRSYRRRRTGR